MSTSVETIEKLLGSNGFLLKPQTLDNVKQIAAQFQAAGIEVEIVSHNENTTSEVSSLAGVVQNNSNPVKAKTPAPISTKPVATDSYFGQRAKGWLSIRWKILPLAILPVLLLGSAWLTDTLTSRAKTSEGLLVRGTLQTASLFARQVLEGIDDSRPGLNTPINIAIVQQNVTDLFHSKVLPLTQVAVTDTKGNLIAVYDEDFDTPNAPLSRFNQPVKTYQKTSPLDAQAIEAMGKQNLEQNTTTALSQAENPSEQNPFARIFHNPNGKSEYFVAYPIENKLGSVHLALDLKTINTPVANSVKTTLIVLGTILALVTAFTSYFANLLSQGMLKLARLADTVSMGDLEQPIHSQSNDEIGDVAQALERMRISLRAAVARISRKS
jgi:HAMP domain-containing protein